MALGCLTLGAKAVWEQPGFPRFKFCRAMAAKYETVPGPTGLEALSGTAGMPHGFGSACRTWNHAQPDRAAHPSSSEQAERAVPTAGFFLALAGANGRLALFSVLCVKCPWRLSGVRGLWPHVYWLFNWSAGLLRVFGGSASAQGIYHDRRLAAAWQLCPTFAASVLKCAGALQHRLVSQSGAVCSRFSCVIQG